MNTNDEDSDEADYCNDEIGTNRRFADEDAVEDEVTETKLHAANLVDRCATNPQRPLKSCATLIKFERNCGKPILTEQIYA